MIIELYNNKAEKNKIGKMPQTLIKSLIGTLRDSTDIINPIFSVTKLLNEDIGKINYVYIPDFNRYYFINNIRYIRNNLYEISCHVDVLESYKESILNLQCRINRQKSQYNVFLSDDEIQLQQDNRIIIKAFKNSIDFTPTLVMVTAGGYDVVNSSEVSKVSEISESSIMNKEEINNDKSK